MTGKDVSTASVLMAFESWRARHRVRESWGLAWFLANEFCQRFYSSHGIVPQVIDREGLGYYGIELARLPCPVNGNDSSPLGRLTMFGDVENWRRGTAGDHGLDAIALCDTGVSASEIVERAVLHMDLPPIPQKTHARCRHKRRGASYELVFRIATIVVLRSESTSMTNHPDHVCRRIAELGQHPVAQKGAPGFLFCRDDREVVIDGEGYVFGTTAENLWLSYMRGKSLGSLVNLVESRLESEAEGEAPRVRV